VNNKLGPIFVEGYDNTGKTTLAHILAEKLDRQYVSGRDHTAGLFPVAMELLETGMPHKVQDRCFISELVYGPLCRGKAGVSYREAQILLDWLKENKAIIIFCDRADEKVLETLDERPQFDWAKKAAIQVMSGYRVIMPLLFPNHIRFNFDIDKHEDLYTWLGI